MKRAILPLLVITAVCLLAAGCMSQTAGTAGDQVSGTPAVQTSTGMLQGPLNVSIGNYKGKLPVFLDDSRMGEVSAGKPLNMTVKEGHHTLKVCDGSVCEQVDVEVKSGIQHSIDFGERLVSDVPGES